MLRFQWYDNNVSIAENNFSFNVKISMEPFFGKTGVYVRSFVLIIMTLGIMMLG